MIGAQDAVQVVQLVMEELAHPVDELPAVLLTVLVLVVDTDPPVPLDVDEDCPLEAEAAVPDVEEFVALLHDLGVNEEGCEIRGLDADNPFEVTQLGGREAPAAPGYLLVVGESVFEVLEGGLEVGTEVGHDLRLIPEVGIAHKKRLPDDYVRDICLLDVLPFVAWGSTPDLVTS